MTLPGRAVCAGGAFTEGAKEFPLGVFAVGALESMVFCTDSVGAGDCLALQPTVSPIPTIATPPTHSAIRRVKPELSIA